MKIKTIVAMTLLFLLTTSRLWAGSLEASFSPLIPEGLQFGDSPATIVEKMQRPPDDEKAFPEGLMAYAYDFGLPREVSEAIKNGAKLNDDVTYDATFPITAIAYLFKQNKLVYITLHVQDCPDANNSKPCETKNLDFKLEKLYGVPRTILMNNVEVLRLYFLDPVGPFEFKIWEMDNNAIISSPQFSVKAKNAFRIKEVNESIMVKFIVICPLKPGGDYDFSDY